MPLARERAEPALSLQESTSSQAQNTPFAQPRDTVVGLGRRCPKCQSLGSLPPGQAVRGEAGGPKREEKSHLR